MLVDREALETALADPDVRASVQIVAPGALEGSVAVSRREEYLRESERDVVFPTIGQWGRNAELRLDKLVEKVAVAIDVSSEVERVLTSQPLRQLRIPLLEGFDDLQVIDDRARSTVTLGYGRASDRSNVEQ